MRWWIPVVLAALPTALGAQSSDAPAMTAEEFMAALAPTGGHVTVGDDLATLEVPEEFRFIGPEGSRRLLVEGWGNPPEATEGVLGMLYPADLSPLDQEGWGIVITFSDDGYVDDAGAESIDYAELLEEMKEGAEDANKERVEAGYGAMHLVGWATPPHYTRETHKLYWAKELDFEGSPEHTLNYNVRILGRRGVLVLNAVAAMSQLAAVDATIPSVLDFTEFNEGHRYADYVSGADKKAAYGVAGLIVGAAAAKTGLLKGLWVAILALKKVLIVALAGVAAFFKRLFGKKEASPHQAA